jgi:hypothetical protein
LIGTKRLLFPEKIVYGDGEVREELDSLL